MAGIVVDGERSKKERGDREHDGNVLERRVVMAAGVFRLFRFFWCKAEARLAGPRTRTAPGYKAETTILYHRGCNGEQHGSRES